MPNIWFPVDFHLGHGNIIRYCNRRFDTVEEMNRPIIERLDSPVKANDILCHGIHNPAQGLQEALLSRLSRLQRRATQRGAQPSVNVVSRLFGVSQRPVTPVDEYRLESLGPGACRSLDAPLLMHRGRKIGVHLQVKLLCSTVRDGRRPHLRPGLA